MDERIIEADADVVEGAQALSALCPRLALAWGEVGQLPLRRKAQGFDQLLSAIIGQQVSTASAAAIRGRMQEAGLTTETAVRAASEGDLRAVGLSRQKMRYARALAEARIDYARLARLPSPEVVRTLVAVPGIGTWTAEIYAMFSLGRADVFAHGDLALQEAARGLYELKERPGERAMREMAIAWSPWRSVAARILWAYYRVDKKREGIR